MADPRNLLDDEKAPEGHLPRLFFYETGPHTGGVAKGSTKVGWTVRTAKKTVEGFNFLINPQGLDRQLGSRATLTATKAGFYVNDFGPAPETITLRQLVAGGRVFDEGHGVFYTAREDIQRFIKTVWLPATRGPNRGRLRVFFHDHHFERGFEERVFFGPNSLTISRDVQLQNVWRFELVMVSLERYPYGEVHANTALPAVKHGRRYIVKRHDTLHSIARKVAGKHASERKVHSIMWRIVELNTFLVNKRARPDGQQAKPMRVYPGEILRLPTG